MKSISISTWSLKQLVLLIISTLIVVVVCILLGMKIYEWPPILWPRTHFEKAAWAGTAENDRYIFANDLLNSGKLNKLTRPQLYELLGQPGVDYEESMMYWIRVDKSPSYVLDIRLKKAGGQWVVERAFIRQRE